MPGKGGKERLMREVLKELVGASAADLACGPPVSGPACLGRFLAALGREKAFAVLDELEGRGFRVGSARTFLSLVYRSAESPTPELKEAVLMALTVLDTVVPDSFLWGKAIEGVEGRISGLVATHLDKLRASYKERRAVNGNEVPFALAVASAASRPAPLGNDAIAVELFGQTTLRLSTQYTILALAGNMFWGFAPHAEELLDRAAGAVSSRYGRLFGVAPVVERGTLYRRVKVSVPASKLMGLRSPVDFPVSVTYNLVGGLQVKYLNYLAPEVEVEVSSKDVAVKVNNGQWTYHIFHDLNMWANNYLERHLYGNLPRARTFGDVTSWYVSSADKALDFVRSRVNNWLSFAVFRLAAVERGYFETEYKAHGRDLGSGVGVVYRLLTMESRIQDGRLNINIPWNVVIVVRDALGREAERRLVEMLNAPEREVVDAPSDLIQAIARGVGAVWHVLVDTHSPVTVSVVMDSTISAADYVELYRKVGKHVITAESTAWRIVRNLAELLRAGVRDAGQQSPIRPSGEAEQDMVPA